MRTLRSRLGPIIELAAPWRREFRYGLASGMTQQVLFIASATTAAYVVARAARGATPHSLTLLLLAMVILVLPQVRTPWLEAISFQAIANRIQVQLRARVFDAIARLTPAGLDGRRSGDLGSTAMADVDVIQRFFAETASTLIVASAVPVIAIAVLACLSWPLALVLAPSLLAAATVPLWLHGHAEQRALQARDELSALSADVVEQVGGLRESLTFGATQQALARLVERTERTASLESARAAAAATETVIAEALSTGGALAVLAVGAALVGHGHLSPALFAPCVVLAALAFGPTTRLVEGAKTLEGVAAAGQRVFALLASASALPAVPLRAAPLSAPLPAPARRSAGLPDPARAPAAAPHAPLTLRLRDVSFRYAPQLPLALDRVSFDVHPGETVALVGHSGAGKSTCADLVLRFWDVESGSVSIGGTDVRELAPSDLHGVVGLVAQDPYLFTTTVRENLCLGRPDATDAEIETAARSANAWEFITALPDGLGTSTGERGVQLSGGQRQRLAIARAFLADPPVLVLDEPLSNLDTDNEQLITEAMSRLRAGRTTLVVAHRLSTIRRADRIVLLDHGRLIATAGHDELIATTPIYARLVASQLPA